MTTVPEPQRVIRLGRRGPRNRAGVALSRREALVLLIPALLPVVVLSVAPLARGIYLGFTDSQAGLGVSTHFIGLDNFRRLIHDDLFINAFKIGAIWAVSVTFIQFCLALGLALLLSQPLHLRWLARSLALPAKERTRALQGWDRAPAARVAHPREDHFIPLLVAAGAAEGEAAERVYHERDFMGGVTASSYRFGRPASASRLAA